MFKKFVHLGSGILLAIIFLWLIFRNIDLNEVTGAFYEANVFLVLAALVAFFFGYTCRIERWRLMLIQDNPALSWRNCSGPLLASVSANNVLPFRAGDVLRAVGFNRRLGISAATSVTTLFVERLLDLLMVVSFLGLALACFGVDSSRLLGVGVAFLMGAAAVILFVLLFPKVFASPAFLLAGFVSKVIPKLGHKMHEELSKVFSALQHMSRGSTMIRLVLWSLLAWCSEGLVFWFAAQALPSIEFPLAAWLALPIGTLATVIPSTPGYVGTFDFFTVKAMMALGNTVAGATAYALLVHALLWIPPTIAGGIYLLINPVNIQKN